MVAWQQHIPTEGSRSHFQRRYAPKTRTGCATCKIRRVKCDEAKPFCNRCQATGRVCDGYGVSVSRPRPIKLAGSDPTSALSTDAQSTVLERRAFDFFRSRTVLCMSAHISDEAWNYFILQVSEAEPAVKHAANALGGLHEARILRNQAGLPKSKELGVWTDFPIKQYSKALQGLQTLLTTTANAKIDVVLVCSLLLIHFEALRDAFDAALVHVDSAFRILYSDITSSTPKVESSLVRALMRIDDQGSLHLGTSKAVPVSPFDMRAGVNKLPTEFRDLVEARDFVNTWVYHNCCFGLTDARKYKGDQAGDIPLEVISQAQELESTFATLDHMLLRDFTHKQDKKLNLIEENVVAMLRAWCKVGRIMNATGLYAETSMFDAYIDQFHSIVDMCSSVMRHKKAEFDSPLMPLDEGVLYPLFFVAIHCRDGTLRRRALSLLKTLSNIEAGIWDIDIIATIAELCIEYEDSTSAGEYLTCADIPEWRRIHTATFSMSERRVNLRILVRSNGMDGGWNEVTISKDCTPGCKSPCDSAGLSNPTYAPLRPFEVWWADPLVSTTTPADLSNSGTPRFDTTNYRVAYFVNQNRRLDSLS